MKTHDDKNQQKLPSDTPEGHCQKPDVQSPHTEVYVCRCLKDELLCWGDNPSSLDKAPAVLEPKKQQKK